MHVVIHPHVRGRPRHRRRAARRCTRPCDGSRRPTSRPGTRWSASRGCTSRSTGSADEDDLAAIERTRCSGCCATCATPSRTGRGCSRGCSTIVGELEEHPPPLPDRGDRGTASSCCGGWPTTTSRSSATASTTSSSEGDERAPARRARHRPRHPARRPAPVGRVPASCPARCAAQAREPRRCWCWPRRTRRATVHRPAYLDYVGVKKFDETGDGRRRAPVPRPVLQRRLHRVGDAHPGAAREGRRRARARSASTPTATPARP